MIIGIDGNEANVKNRVGVGQYAYNLLLNLYKIDNQNKYIIYLKSEPLPDFPKPKTNWVYKVFGPQKLWTKIALPLHLFLQKEKLTLFFSLSHYSPSFSPFPTIPTIHDLGYLQFQDQFNKKDLYQLINWTSASIKKAKHIITVSEFTKNEIEKIYKINPQKISIAFNGVGELPQISNLETKNTLKKFNIKNPYFLYVGTLKPNKNLPFLIEAFSLFLKKNPNYNLVIAGKKGWLFTEIFQTVKNLKLDNQIIFTDYVSETEKWILYKNSICSVIPSLYEGFGIPAIEAMKAGTPVISSNIPALKEVVGSSGLLIDPTDLNDLANKMEQICDKEIRKKYTDLGTIRSQNFTWENTAKSILNVFQNLCSDEPMCSSHQKI